jgi:hypothetical protein
MRSDEETRSLQCNLWEEHKNMWLASRWKFGYTTKRRLINFCRLAIRIPTRELIHLLEKHQRQHGCWVVRVGIKLEWDGYIRDAVRPWKLNNIHGVLITNTVSLLYYFINGLLYICTVVGRNLCVPRPLEVKGKGIRGATDKEAYTVHTINIISQRQYYVASCLSSMSAMSLVYIVQAFVFLLTIS